MLKEVMCFNSGEGERGVRFTETFQGSRDKIQILAIFNHF